jgi:O-antigen/teichoic acid export membrane protein
VTPLLARAVILNTLGTLATVVLGFAAAVLVARWLGPSDRGLFALMWLVGALVVAIFGLGVPISITYHLSSGASSTAEVLGAALAWAAVLGMVFVPLSWVLRDELADLVARGQGGDAWVLVGLLVPAIFLGYATLQFLVGLLRFGWSNALRATSRAVFVGLLALLLGALGYGVSGALTALIVSWLTVVVLATPLIVRYARPRFSRSSLGSILRYGLLVQLGTVSAFASLRLDILVLQHFRELDQVGVYAVAQSVAETVTILAVGFAGSMLPLVARLEGSERQDLTGEAIRNCSLLGAVAVAGLALFGPLLVPVVFGQDFADAVTPLLILLPSMWFLGIALAVGSTLRGYARPGLASLLAGFSMVVTIGLDLLLIPSYGVNGAAVASAVAYVLYGASSVIYLGRVAGLPIAALIVPTRADIDRYPRAARRAMRLGRPKNAAE